MADTRWFNPNAIFSKDVLWEIINEVDENHHPGGHSYTMQVKLLAAILLELRKLNAPEDAVDGCPSIPWRDRWDDAIKKGIEGDAQATTPEVAT